MASRKKMVICQEKKNESQQIRVSPNDTARCIAGGSIRLYLRRGSRNRSFSGMANPPDGKWRQMMEH